MFYETAQTVGPGWHRSYKPSHYEDMTWTPSSRHFRSPGSSPETYRRIIRNDEGFPERNKEQDDDFFGGRRSPTFPRRIFKDAWNESPSSNHRFSDRPKLFKRVFRPDRWEDEFDRDIPHLRRVEREFDSNLDSGGPTRKFDDEFEKRFNARDFKKDIEDDFETSSDGRVHHIPILIERRMNDSKPNFGKNDKASPTQQQHDEDFTEEWTGPQVQNLKKNFEQPEEKLSSRFKLHKNNTNFKPRPYFSQDPASDSWDPHAIHTLPTRKAHKSSQSFDDSRHHVPPKYVFRSHSETHEDNPRQQQPHSAAFRSHSDGHCPKQTTHVTKIQVNLPSQMEKDELGSPSNQSKKGSDKYNYNDSDHENNSQNTFSPGDSTSTPKGRNKYDNPSMQQIAVVLQNVEDLVIRVENYSGAGRDKQYRFLDEMLTRCMLRLDDVDTEGREDIRNARKAAVRVVQNCIDKLEAKADESERRLKHSKSSTKILDDKKLAIPLKDKEDSNHPSQSQAIPLPAGSIKNEDASIQNKAIPLGDKKNNANEQKESILVDNDPNKKEEPQNKAIPLGYTEVVNRNKNVEDKSQSKSESVRDEQTKL